jgi:hypothetical protein
MEDLERRVEEPEAENVGLKKTAEKLRKKLNVLRVEHVSR